ncbi:putative CCR4-associated factor 1 homolog 8 [Curcuma longa]|uniref:putative CCR4-associated factor 1 homolog 8 n=1 Tax=Curcuma longa TaxID=136217 RepID=UPI003D9F5550
MAVIEVWKQNLMEQIELIALLRRFFPIVAFDTEFSGFLRFTARHASEEERYSDLKYNVDNLRIIQLGISLFDASGRQPMPRVAWQINFSDFDPGVDSCSSESMRLLKNSGINLQRNRREGVSSVRCAALLREKLFDHHSGSFVTFHGSYDVGYLMKMLTGGKPLPETLSEFVTAASTIFCGRLYDLKYMARFCHGLHGGELGLMKLASLLNVEADGVAHQAGFDSLVIGLSFHKMRQRWVVEEDRDSMILYGLQSTCQKIKNTSSNNPLRRPTMILPPPAMSPPCAFPPRHFSSGDHDGGIRHLLPATPHGTWFQWTPPRYSFPGTGVAMPYII